jgi:YidC/Oxa1 family membrane protein insertase
MRGRPSPLSFDPGLRLPLAIPVLSQYVNFLKYILEHIGERVGSGGLAIVIFTIIIRTLILPITIRSTKSMKAMQDIQPKIKDLQKKHKGDRTKIQQETMALYSAYGVNPVAGCLPSLLQLPIFFGVYRAIHSLSVNDTGIWHGGFLWLNSLKSPDPWHILPIAAGLFQLMQTFMARPAGAGKATDQQQQMMNTMMNIMPITVVLFGWTFASGSVVYWVTQSIYGIIQQWFITGWGKINDFVPGLPELPEHKRLGYHAPRDLEAIDLTNLPKKKSNPFSSWWERQMEQANVISEERKAKARDGGSAAGTLAAEAALPRKSVANAARPYSRNSPKGRMLAEQSKRSPTDQEIVADIADEARQSADIPATVEARTTPRRVRKARK